MPDITEQEKKWIASLGRVLKRMPNSLWLFATGGLYVMRKDVNGRHAVLPGGSMDQDYFVESFAIDADGGYW